MQTLSPQKQASAVTYLKEHGRPLEKALYAHYFEGGSAQAVFDALATYQNPDGGFGHALEADVRLADSSVIATTVALQKLRDLKTPATHPLIQGACAYLLFTYDAPHQAWPIIPPNVDDAPHAPWWTYNPDVTHHLHNPRAEVAGYLIDYAELFPQGLPERLLENVVATFQALPDEVEMHEIYCYIRLSETPRLPPATRALLLEKLRRIVNHAVARDPESWKSYGLAPLSIVNTPASPFADLFEKELPLNLDFEIARQPAEGYWSPNWSWADASPQGWAQAQDDWRSYLTFSNLWLFKQFGRLS